MANNTGLADHLLSTFPEAQDWGGWVEFWCRHDNGNIDCVPEPLRPLVAHLVTPEGWLKLPDSIPNSPYKIARWFHIQTIGSPRPPWIGTGITPSWARQIWDERQQEKAAEAERFDQGQSDLYFIQSEAGPIKIGMSGDVDRRLKTLQSSCPVELVFACVVKGAGLQEPEYHARFAEHRLHGEWFSPHPDILAEITRLKAEASQ